MKSISRRALVSACGAIVSTGIVPKLGFAAPGHRITAQRTSRPLTMTQGQRQAPTSTNPFVISNPSIAFVNFLGDRGKGLIDADRIAIEDLFKNNILTANNTLPKCDVLFLYGELQPSGRIADTPLTLGDAVKETGARVAVMASDIQPDLLSNNDFAKSFSGRPDWAANIVITLNRNGEHFGRFFHELFSQMKAGVSMPMAWVELAPQGPHQPEDIPAAIFLMEAGHIAFG